jgi:broad specificity phosphatase PhoE
MDAAVKPDRPMNTAPSSGRASGRIIIVRHGRPELNRNAGPRLDWRAYREWWSKYEQSSLADGQKCPEALMREIPADAIVLSSMRPRAMQTADVLARGREVRRDATFNEAPLPPPRWRTRHLPKTWNKIARLAWLMGHHDGDEHVRDAKRRAAKAAGLLIDTAGEGRDVVLAAHGWFNRMLRPQLLKRGWTCVHDGGDKYWSYRIYQKR